jgi:hypothetical protein
MRTRGPTVFRVSVDVEVANNDDLALMRHGFLRPGRVRRETIPGVVDSSAAIRDPYGNQRTPSPRLRW